MKVKIMNTRDDARVLDKSTTLLSELTCKLKNGTSIINPTLIINIDSLTEFTSANYCYIPKFSRYYYINNINTGLGGNLEIECHVDVLKSNASGIRGITTYIVRQERLYNNYIFDSELPTRVKRFREKKNIGTVGNGAENYYLTVNNGGD